jgi:NAD(P)-dependent dehydrogenase (short-subunit alcohol dehydrogenase family)
VKLNGKVAIVTGGARGIGAAICRRYADEGARVAVADILAEEAEALAHAIGRGALGVPLDVTKQASIEFNGRPQWVERQLAPMGLRPFTALCRLRSAAHDQL